MSNHHRNTSFRLGILLSLIVVVVLSAAPILPDRRNLPDEFLCLADIRTVSIDVDPVAVEGMVLNEKTLKMQFRKSLRASGFRVIAEPRTPRLTLQIIKKTHHYQYQDCMKRTSYQAVKVPFHTLYPVHSILLGRIASQMSIDAGTCSVGGAP